MKKNKPDELLQVVKKTIPEDYRQFLIHSNPETLKNKIYYIPPNIAIRTPFNLIKINNFLPVEKIVKHKKLSEWLQKNFLPIAYDKFFNLILLNLDTAQIYIHNKQDDKIYLIAVNFDDLLSKLY